jgi:hypothetical protein
MLSWPYFIRNSVFLYEPSFDHTQVHVGMLRCFQSIGWQFFFYRQPFELSSNHMFVTTFPSNTRRTPQNPVRFLLSFWGEIDETNPEKNPMVSQSPYHGASQSQAPVWFLNPERAGEPDFYDPIHSWIRFQSLAISWFNWLVCIYI